MLPCIEKYILGQDGIFFPSECLRCANAQSLVRWAAIACEYKVGGWIHLGNAGFRSSSAGWDGVLAVVFATGECRLCASLWTKAEAQEYPSFEVKI
jgi:hypothetical protein